MANENFIERLLSEITTNTDNYGYYLSYGDNNFSSNEREFRILSLGEDPEHAEAEGFWCPDADIIAEITDERIKSNGATIFFWTRGALARSDYTLFNYYDQMTNDDKIAYAALRHHGENTELHGYYSVEIRLSDNTDYNTNVGECLDELTLVKEPSN